MCGNLDVIYSAETEPAVISSENEDVIYRQIAVRSTRAIGTAAL